MIVILLFVSSCKLIPTPQPADVVANVSPSVVKVITENGSGSGVKIDRGVITCEHVVQGSSRVEIVTKGGDRVSAVVSRTDPQLDLALLLTEAVIPPVKMEPALQQRQGDNVLVLGYPLQDNPYTGGPATLTRGLISALRQETTTGRILVQTDAVMNHGNSGGPIFNSRGTLIALVSFGLQDSNGLGFGIGSETIEAFLAGTVSSKVVAVSTQTVVSQPTTVPPNSVPTPFRPPPTQTPILPKPMPSVDPVKMGSLSVYQVAYSSSGSLFAAATSDGNIGIWDPRTGKLLQKMVSSISSPGQMALNDSVVVIVGRGQGGGLAIDARNTATGLPIWKPYQAEANVDHLAASPTGMVVTSDKNDWVKYWNVQTNMGKRSQIAGVSSLAFSPNGNILAVGTKGGELHLWDLVASQELHVLSAGQAKIAGIDEIVFSPSGRTVAAFGYFGADIWIWDVASGKGPLTLSNIMLGARVYFDPHEQLVSIESSFSSSMTQWNMSTGDARAKFTLPGAPSSLAISPDGEDLVIGFHDGTMRVYTYGN